MFRFLFTSMMVAMILAGSAAAQGTFGLGIVVGEPTGVSGKLWLSGRSAVDMAAAWSFRDEAALTLQADYLLHNFDLIDVEKGQLPVYFGVGGRVKFENESKAGVRIPVGLAYIFEDVPLDAFFEIAPILDLVPDTDFAVNAAVGIRFFFGGSMNQ
ncbi:MAG: hypothetical protein P8181_06345 [bacterium]